MLNVIYTVMAICHVWHYCQIWRS